MNFFLDFKLIGSYLSFLPYEVKGSNVTPIVLTLEQSLQGNQLAPNWLVSGKFSTATKSHSFSFAAHMHGITVMS